MGVDEGLRNPTPPVAQHMQSLPCLPLLRAQAVDHLLQGSKDCVALQCLASSPPALCSVMDAQGHRAGGSALKATASNGNVLLKDTRTSKAQTTADGRMALLAAMLKASTGSAVQLEPYCCSPHWEAWAQYECWPDALLHHQTSNNNMFKQYQMQEAGGSSNNMMQLSCCTCPLC